MSWSASKKNQREESTLEISKGQPKALVTNSFLLLLVRHLLLEAMHLFLVASLLLIASKMPNEGRDLQKSGGVSLASDSPPPVKEDQTCRAGINR